MADPWTDAWVEAETTAPPTIVIYDTIELIHPAFVNLGTPFSIRAVGGSPTPVMLTLESGALLDPDTSVEFSAIPFSTEFPEFTDGKTPEVPLVIDNVAREIIPYLETAVQFRADMVAIYRQYRSDDVMGPCYGPITFQVRQVKVSGTRVTGTLRVDNLANKKFPNKVYTIGEFPGLQP